MTTNDELREPPLWLTAVTSMIVPLLIVGIVVGFRFKLPWLAWPSVALLASLVVFAVAFSMFSAVAIPVFIFRDWQDHTTLGKFILGLLAFVLLASVGIMISASIYLWTHSWS